MAGIGFSLRYLARQPTLNAGVRAHVYAGVLACGPWLLTVASLIGIQSISAWLLGIRSQPLFATIVIYNFCFSLVLAGAVVLPATRHLSDIIYDRRIDEISGFLVGTLALLFVIGLLVGGFFYGFVVQMGAIDRLLALANFVIIGGLWVVVAFLSALKRYRAIALAFLVGLSVAVLLALILASHFGQTGALAGFTVGLAIVFYTLVGLIIADFDRLLTRPLAILSALARYWEYTMAGLLYNAGVWAGNWVMWVSPGHMTVAGAMPVSPAYDSAIFLAFLSIVPAMTLFLIAVETRFFERHTDFYRAVGQHGTLTQIKYHHERLIRCLTESFRNAAIFQVAISYLAIVMAEKIVEITGGGMEMVSIFRLGVLGALFNFFLLSTLVIMSYFDLRRMLLHASAVFLVLNAACTYATTLAGQEFYGYGYFIASMLAFLYAYVCLSRALSQLPYMTFVANNRGLG